MPGRFELKSVAEAALLVSITVVLGVAGAYVPLVPLLYPIPIVLLIVRHGSLGGWAVLLTVVGASMIIGPFDAALMFLNPGIVGVAIGMCLRRKAGAGATLVVAAATFLISMALSFALGWLIGGLSIPSLAELQKSYENALNTTIQMFGRYTKDPKQLELATETVKAAGAFLMRVLPAVFAWSSVLWASIVLGLTRSVLRRLGEEVPAVPTFASWRFRDVWAWGYILGMAMLVLGPYLPFGNTRVVGILGENLRVLFMILFFVQGLSVAWFFAQKYNVAGPLAVLLAFLVLMNPLLEEIVAWVGLLDVWFDFRRIDRAHRHA